MWVIAVSSDEMRNLLVIAGALSGYFVDLYRCLAAKWPCKVRVIHELLPTSSSFSHEQVRLEDLESLIWTNATAKTIARFIQECAPDAVIVHGTRPARVLGIAFLALPMRTPIFFASDTNIYDLITERRKLIPRLAVYRILFSRVHSALSLGLSNEEALRLLGAPSIEHLPICPIDFDAFDKAGSQSSPANSKEKQVVIIARQVKEKNLEAAIGAIKSDLHLREGVVLSMVGDGPLRPDLEKLAADGKVKARFFGALPRARVGSVLAHADALLLPSTYEPWGIVVCEALGMGIPVIASPAVGAATSLAGQSGAVVVAKSPQAADLAEALRSFMARAELLASAARASAAAVREVYSLPHVTERLARLLERTCRRDAN